MEIRESIMKNFQEGSFEAFYREVYPSLFRYAERVLGNDDAFMAEDCVQEAIYNLYRNRQRFDNPTQMKSFLFTCLRNEIVTVFRKNDRHTRYLKNARQWENDVIDQFVMQETLDKLYAAIDSLPEPLRQIFDLGFEQGMKNVEIAEMLKLSPSAIKKRKAKMISMLREKLSDDPLSLIFLSIFLG